MRLTPMRYKDYIWPHNPAVYSITFQRQVAVHKVPFGRYCTQDLGMGARVMRGEGEFAGAGAYEAFKKLATVFYQDGPGILVHPLWQASNAYFTELSLEQQPTPDYVRYRFAFQERYNSYDEALKAVSAAGGDGVSPHTESRRAIHSVSGGDTLWGIAGQYGVELEALLNANPEIKNPNLISIGQKVVVPC